MEIDYISQGLARKAEPVGYVHIYKKNWFSQLWGLSKQAPHSQDSQEGKVNSHLEIHEFELELKL